jgi:Ca2+-transporting ATPase
MNYQGLTDLEAQKILIENGLNEIPSPKSSNFIKSFTKTLFEPMIIILLLACSIYFFIGEIRDFLILTFSAFVILSINIFQNYKADEAIKRLKSLTKNYSEVIREGTKKIIESKYLVEGDYVIVNEGDRVPADLIIVESSNLLVDESILTGESVPVEKKNFAESNSKNFSEEHLAYSGTLILSGWFVGIVHKTGLNTKIGGIGKKLELIKDEEPQVKKEINGIVYKLAILCVITCSLVFSYNFYQSQNLTLSALTSISLAIALVPEELPIVLTIFLALSSLRLSKLGLIIKNKAIVETLGATNIICVDKTGTITQNKLKLKKILLNNAEFEIENLALSDEIKDIVSAAFFATYFNSKDSSDLEIINLYKKLDLELPKFESLAENVIPRKFVYSKKYYEKKYYYTYAKGAYEEIQKISRINKNYEDFYLNKIEELSNIGFRVIAVAYKKEIKEESSKKFELLGLLAFQDELREETTEYINLCQTNNIRICMITGDYKNTAIYFAKEIGLNNYNKVLTGKDIDDLPDEILKEKIKETNVFARITPKQKLKIVNLLKINKNIVAMTGDGINDVLALKSANVGISIGEGGSDIAKEASDVILTENNLKSIVNAIKEGRRVYNNLAITGRYIYSFHIPIILIALFNTFLALPPLLLPVQIALLEFIIDPFSTLVFESIPATKGILAEKPRRGKYKLMENLNLKLGTFYGVLIFLLVFIPYLILIKNNYQNVVNLSLLNILGLNIVLIILNFYKEGTVLELVNNKRFSYSLSILLIIFILGIFYLQIDTLGVITIVSCLIIFLFFGIISKNDEIR